ncbi:MAG TPA: N-acyl homoserine lactonase family protein [Sphingomicrobium sp.]
MRRSLLLVSASLMIASCRVAETGNDAAAATNDTADANVLATPAAGTTSLVRLDCGDIQFKDMDAFFSDTPGVYPPGPGRVVDSCYLIQHDGQQMIWDTGFPAELKGSEYVQGQMTATISKTLEEQLAQLNIKPADIDVVGISHMHGDHTGQAAKFPQARLVVGKGDFEQSTGKDDGFGPWRGEGKQVELATGDVDIFGDGSVVAIHLPGHTPNHLALLVKLKSGPVLLSGDLYHSTIAREKRAMPGFNTDKQQTLASMDRFEKIASDLKAKVVIQHEPDEVAKLPAFPAAAE